MSGLVITLVAFQWWMIGIAWTMKIADAGTPHWSDIPGQP